MGIGKKHKKSTQLYGVVKKNNWKNPRFGCIGLIVLLCGWPFLFLFDRIGWEENWSTFFLGKWGNEELLGCCCKSGRFVML